MASALDSGACPPLQERTTGDHEPGQTGNNVAVFEAQDLRIRRAHLHERDQILDLLTEAADWLFSRGIRQWPSPLPVAGGTAFAFEPVLGTFAPLQALLPGASSFKTSCTQKVGAAATGSTFLGIGVVAFEVDCSGVPPEAMFAEASLYPPFGSSGEAGDSCIGCSELGDSGSAECIICEGTWTVEYTSAIALDEDDEWLTFGKHCDTEPDNPNILSCERTEEFVVD